MSEKNNENMTAAEMLLNARTNGRRKRELQTVARQLCIREEFLSALEEGRYTEIPETVYILGFARNYAIELGLDPDEIVRKIKKEMNIEDTSDAAVMPAAVPESKSVEKKSAEKKSSAKKRVQVVGAAARGAGEFARKNWIWISGLAIVIILAIIGVILIGRGGRAPMPSPDIPVVAAPTIPAPAFKRDVKESFGVENKSSASIVFQANSETWLKVESERGETLFSRVMVPGDVYYAPAGGVATVGNAGGLDVFVNGVAAPALGANHTRRSGIALTPEALAASTINN